jgi:hypothetical protein
MSVVISTSTKRLTMPSLETFFGREGGSCWGATGMLAIVSFSSVAGNCLQSNRDRYDIAVHAVGGTLS